MAFFVFIHLPLLLLFPVILISGNSGNSEMFFSLDRVQVGGAVYQRCDVIRFTSSNVFDCAITCLQLYGTSTCLAVHFNVSGECGLCVTDEAGCASQIQTLDGESDVELVPSSLPGNSICCHGNSFVSQRSSYSQKFRSPIRPLSCDVFF